MSIDFLISSPTIAHESQIISPGSWTFVDQILVPRFDIASTLRGLPCLMVIISFIALVIIHHSLPEEHSMISNHP